MIIYQILFFAFRRIKPKIIKAVNKNKIECMIALSTIKPHITNAILPSNKWLMHQQD